MRSRFRQLRNTYGNSDLKFMKTDAEQADRDSQAMRARVEAQMERERTKVVHPAIKAPEHKCYRVIRRYLLHDHIQIEDIGAFSRALGAYDMARKEQGNAIIVDPNNKTIHNNAQPIEVRG